MSFSVPSIILLGLFVALSVLRIVQIAMKSQFHLGSHLNHIWLFLLSFTVAEFISFSLGIGVLLLLSFWALREYYSLVDMRLQDRLGILGGYLSIPFMYYFILIDWYGMFIVSIPVYSFLTIPLLVTLGGKEAKGSVFSIGAIVLGLFLFVFCVGHIGYLLLYSTWKACALVLSVAISDLIGYWLTGKSKTAAVRFLLYSLCPIPVTVGLMCACGVWTEIPIIHSIFLGLLIPPLVAMGHHTIDYIKTDLGISDEQLIPGRGRILDSIKSFLYAAPVAFHYIRYFLT